MSTSPPTGKVDQALNTTRGPALADHVPQVPETEDKLKADAQIVAGKSWSGLRSLVAGGIGGSCSVIVGHPFDLVKVRLQTVEKGVYKNAIDVVRKSIAKDGLARGLYAGVSAPLVGVTPMFAVAFWGYDVGKKIVHRYSIVENGQLSIAQVSFAGFFSAVPQIALTGPFERVKVLLQVQGQKILGPGETRKYSGGLDVVRQLYKEGGIRSVYRGSVATLARDGPGCAAYFGTYEYVKRRLTPVDPVTGKTSGTPSVAAITSAGGAAGIVMWTLIYPVDTMKSRLQAMEGNPTIGGIIRGLYMAGGVRAFFPGFGAAIARAVPANAATFLGVELAHRAMNKAFD